MRWKFWTKLLISLLLLFAVLVFLSPSFHHKYFGVDKYEVDAVSSLVKINSLERQYAASHPDKGFACELMFFDHKKVEPTHRIESRDF